ncbi:MAG: apolipoprotein N-acyltransferase, partial [Rhodospirillaceae bacterium]
APRATLEPKVAPRATLEPKVAPRATLEPAPVPEHSVRFWNSMIAEDGAGRIIASYDKFHLVPFGEYIPGRELLPSWLPIGAIAARGSDFSPGPGPRTLHLPGLPPVSPLICYEAIFPRAVIDDGDRPAWLLNLTNDAWYGRTAGPHQHFAIAQTRAVEEGLPLVRVANTGISGVVDSYGRITAWLSLGKAGIIDTALPPALPQPTLYARFGDSILGLMLLICCLFLVIAPRIITSDAASKDNPPPAFPSAG